MNFVEVLDLYFLISFSPNPHYPHRLDRREVGFILMRVIIMMVEEVAA